MLQHQGVQTHRTKAPLARAQVVENTFGGEVESGGRASCAIAPIDCALAVAVLVVIQDPVCVFARVPELPERHLRHCGINVLLGEFPACRRASKSLQANDAGNLMLCTGHSESQTLQMVPSLAENRKLEY